MRWVVGDIQGCAREFEKLLSVIRFDPKRDELWCLGDLINRGPDSLATLRIWSGIGGRSLLGNHEIHALLAFSGVRPEPPCSLRGLFAAPDVDELLARLRACPVLVHLPSPGGGPEAWIVHAGLKPAWSDLPALARRLNAQPHDDAWLQSGSVRFATSVRCCTAEGRPLKYSGPPAGCTSPYQPWDSFYRGNVLVVHGHWAARGFYRNRLTMGLDSGCVYGGELTAWCQEEDRLVRIPAISG